MIDAVFLNVGRLSAPFNQRVLQIRRRRSIAAESAPVRREALLQRSQVGAVQNKSFQRYPAAIEPYFHPAVDDAARRQAVRDARDGALLQRFVDGESVKPAGDAAGP